MSVVPAEILKKIRRIEIRTNRRAQDLFAGQYHSVFKGKGMDFDEVREYHEGDDVRRIDWNVTARMDYPHVKVFKEERELTVNLLVDVSGSGDIGSGNRSKRDLAAELSSVLAFSAIRNNDRVGLILFSDHVEKYVPPGKGQSHVLRVIRDILFHTPVGRKTNVSEALRYLNQVTPRTCIAFLVSDFLDDNMEQSLMVTSRKHDLIAVHISDPIEAEIPALGWVVMEDAETGELIEFDAGSARNRERYSGIFKRELEGLREYFKRLGIDLIETRTDRDYERDLELFFRMRNERQRHG